MRNSARWLGLALLLIAAVARAQSPLPRDVQRALAGSGLPLASFGVHVQPVDTARAVATLNAESPYVLASTAKIVTALAALDILGPNYRWRTHAFVNGPVVDGRLLGDLIIVGGGNASLSSSELLGWMQRMRMQGLNHIRGDILVDRSAFRLSETDHRHTPLPAPDRPHHVWPDALTLDQGVLHVRVQGTHEARAEVQTVPPLAGLALVNKVATGGGCSAAARWAQDKFGAPQLVVEGRWGRGCGPGELALVPPPAAGYVAHAMAGLWRQAGGKLDGRVREVDLSAPGLAGSARPPWGSGHAAEPHGLASRGDDPRSRLPMLDAEGEPVLPWSTHLSDPLPVLLREMNKSSNNLAARHLMLSMARGFPLKPASMTAAQQSVDGWLRRQGLAEGDIALENGSGLSREERGKPRALVQLLVNAWRSKESRAFVDSLPVAGVDGTLQHRMQRGLAAGRAFLKTGTLLDARALAGYVQGASGKIYAVAALVNHPEAARATPALDALIEWLAKNG